MKRIMVVMVLIITGLGLILWPIARGIWLDCNSTTIADEFVSSRATEEDPCDKLKAEMERYNQRIFDEKQAYLNAPWAYENVKIGFSRHAYDDCPIGVIDIPDVQVTLPLYIGASQEKLALGAAVLGETSMPIGGINTNCVIAGHRGYQGADFFRYVPDLEIGNLVRIINLWDILEYRVVKKEIIDPADVKKVFIQEGKDMVTLLTCHPYGGGGRERYVIYCERVTS